MRMWRILATAHAVAIISWCAGCIEPFAGANLALDLSSGTPVQAQLGDMPGGSDLPAQGHFTIDAFRRDGEVVSAIEVTRFEIHKVVDLSSPCFIDIGNVPFPGVHISQFGAAMAAKTGIVDLANPPATATEQDKIDAATAVQRMSAVTLLSGSNGLKALVSASPTTYPAPDADCGGAGLPPPTCIDEASNARRLSICQQIWADDPELYEGTDRVLTGPIAGRFFGMVTGVSPVTPAAVGGSAFFVEQALTAVDDYSISFHTDDGTSTSLLFAGTAAPSAARGILHVHMESPARPGLMTADMAVYTDLSQDTVEF